MFSKIVAVFAALAVAAVNAGGLIGGAPLVAPLATSVVSTNTIHGSPLALNAGLIGTRSVIASPLNAGLIGAPLNAGLIGAPLNAGLIGAPLNAGLIGARSVIAAPGLAHAGLIGAPLSAGIIGSPLNAGLIGAPLARSVIAAPGLSAPLW